jgi:uncharacterized lipoprotein YajG
MRLAILAGALLLAGCASSPHSCVTIKPMTPQEQSALAGAVSSLPADSPIITAMGDYKRMRDESRVCALIAR